MITPDPYWVSQLRGTISVNGREPQGPTTQISEWVRQECVNGEAVGDLVKTLTDRFYGSQELPLAISIVIEELPGHGEKRKFVSVPYAQAATMEP